MVSSSAVETTETDSELKNICCLPGLGRQPRTLHCLLPQPPLAVSWVGGPRHCWNMMQIIFAPDWLLMLAACDASSKGLWCSRASLRGVHPWLVWNGGSPLSDCTHTELCFTFTVLKASRTSVAVNLSHTHSHASMVLEQFRVLLSCPVTLSLMDSRNRDSTHWPFGHWTTHSTSWASAGTAHTLEKNQEQRKHWSSHSAQEQVKHYTEHMAYF